MEDCIDLYGRPVLNYTEDCIDLYGRPVLTYTEDLYGTTRETVNNKISFNKLLYGFN